MARLRLNINLVSGKAVPEIGSRRLNTRNFATTIVRDVGIQYSDRRWKELKSTIQGQIHRDVTREIESIARQYKSLVVAAGAQRASRGTIRSSVQGASNAAGTTFAQTQMPFPNRPWTPLSPRYAAWKAKQGAPAGHFALKGKLGQEMSKASTWTGMFGPVSVRIIRTEVGSERRDAPTITRHRGDLQQTFSIAKIEVRALGEITARMLPALTGGQPGFSGDGPALMALAYRNSPDLEHRLAGNMKNVPYRATVEPFLGFVLTKAIPAAVHNRVSTLVRGSLVEREHSVKRPR